MDGKPLWQDYLPEAWAAIMAVREPDPAMIGAGTRRAAEGMGDDIGGIYRAMIDAAMEGQPNAPPSGAERSGAVTCGRCTNRSADWR